MVDVDATITHRLRTRFAAAQGRVAELPESVRYAALRLVERVRTALDIPSRTELAELSARLEELDRRIAELATARVEELARPIPSLPAPAEDEAVAAAAETAAEIETVTETTAEPETAAEPAAESAMDAKDARRRKIGRRASANKTSRR
jgi:hypothetical protein